MRVSADDPESFSSCLLPKGVADIDSEDSHDPQLVSQYAKDIFNYLAWLEVPHPTLFSSDQDASLLEA